MPVVILSHATKLYSVNRPLRLRPLQRLPLDGIFRSLKRVSRHGDVFNPPYEKKKVAPGLYILPPCEPYTVSRHIESIWVHLFPYGGLTF